MPLITHIPEAEIVDNETYEESLKPKPDLSLQEIGAKLQSTLPELKNPHNVAKILSDRGASVEYLVDGMIELMNSTEDDKLRKDLLLEALDMHGVRKQQDKDSTNINLIIQDGNVKVQQVLLPNRD
jgi:hypothetical protein